MNASTRNRNKLYPLATAGFLAIAMAATAPAMAKSDKPYHEAPDEGSAARWNEQSEQVTAEYLYVCRVGSAIKYRIEPRDGDFFDLGSSESDYRLAPRLGTCA